MICTLRFVVLLMLVLVPAAVAALFGSFDITMGDQVSSLSVLLSKFTDFI